MLDEGDAGCEDELRESIPPDDDDPAEFN